MTNVQNSILSLLSFSFYDEVYFTIKSDLDIRDIYIYDL